MKKARSLPGQAVTASCRTVLACAIVVSACSSDDQARPTAAVDAGWDGLARGGGAGAPAAGGTAGIGGAVDGGDAGGTPASPCPPDMVAMPGFCVDRYEAPNHEGRFPLVMYTFVEAEGWCAARGKRLCFDDEWTDTCEGTSGTAYPYGDAHEPGVCNDARTWRLYDQDKLNGWPPSASSPDVESLEGLLAAARAVSPSAAVAADHVLELYQAAPSGASDGCVGDRGAYDLTGNVEEWTRRRDGGSGPDFHGSLEGRYWAEARTCQSAVTSHGDGFRFYEIGFRCCSDEREGGVRSSTRRGRSR